jgi:hypothetical protein
MKNKFLLASGIASAVISLGANALADNAATIEADPSGTAVNYTGGIITSVLSAPVGSLDGYNYTKYAILAQDATGSIDLFGALPSGSTYVPTVGDQINVSGTYSPFDQIPEIASITSISQVSSGNTVPAPVVYTIPQLTSSSTIPLSQEGYLLSLNNVSLYTSSAATIPVSGNFATHANTTLYAEDGSGNIMEVYVWASSYSTDGALGGTPIPTGPVDITGFVSQSGTFPVQITPFSITSVPEPASMTLGGVAALLAMAWRRRS